MKNRIIILSLCASCLLAIVAFVYNSETKTDPLALSPIVAKRVTTPTGTLVSCNLKALKDTVDIPLSYLTEELQVVKLDNRDEALVGGWIRTTVGEKYILVSNNKQTPYKLFTRDGKFITTIGAYGQGPNEYGNTYADQLDEAHNRIYILPWQSDKLLVFDLQGNPQPPIPLCMRVPKGKFRVDTEKSEVTLTTLPFEGWPAVVWTQDFKGKRKNFIAPGHLTVPRDFSNEVFMDNNTNDYGVMLMVIMPAPRTDSLYHYNAAQNRLEARFTVEYPNKEKIPWHGYSEYPRHFIGDVSVPIQVSENTWSGSKPAKYIIDKKTLHGSYFRLYNDFLGTKNPRLWGSLKHMKGNTPVNLKGKTVNAWNYSWLDLETALQEGAKAINTCDAFLYIVPAVNYYHNFLDHQWIYESWSPRMMQEGEMIEQSTNLLGAMFAVWNDRVGNGISQQDVHIRTFPAMQVMSEKLWKGENTRNIPFETFETWCRTTPEAPGVNLQASIDDRKDLTLSGQEIILQGNDSVLTSIPEIGYPYSVEFEIYADPKPNIDAVLFKGPHSVFTANWQNTGKFAFSRDGYEFIFHSYRLPVEKWTKVRVEGDAKGTSLYINGELQERLEGRIGVVYNQKSLRKDSIWYQETLIFPLKQIGDKLLGFKGRIRNVICTPLNEKRYSL